jgi:hypothetical protein
MVRAVIEYESQEVGMMIVMACDNSIAVTGVNHHNSSIKQFFIYRSSYHSQQPLIIPTLKAGS